MKFSEAGRQNEIPLRFGRIASVYYHTAGLPVPNQMDLIDAWFPCLVIHEDTSDGNTKKPAFYADREYMIHAVKYHGRFYSGGSTRVSQILGRLTGTASGNQEKERKTAELIQRHIAECFIRDMTLTPKLKDNACRMIGQMTDKQAESFYDILCELIWNLAAQRRNTEKYERDNEPFSMYDETFDGVIYNAGYQLSLSSFTGLCNAFLWLLTGGLLRNETGRVLHLYDSSFLAIRRQASETGELEDKLNSLFHPEQYYYTFDGDENDLKHRFPDVWWICDGCGAKLNDQKGFDDHLPEWKCTKCGYVNKIDISEIYDNEEDAQNHIRQSDPEKFARAVAARKEELKKSKS